MMQRATATADRKRISRGNGRGDISFGVPRGHLEVKSSRQPGSNGRLQGAATAVGIIGGDALFGKASDPGRLDQNIDAFRPITMTAFDQNGPRTKAQQRACLFLDVSFRMRG